MTQRTECDHVQLRDLRITQGETVLIEHGDAELRIESSVTVVEHEGHLIERRPGIYSAALLLRDPVDGRRLPGPVWECSWTADSPVGILSGKALPSVAAATGDLLFEFDCIDGVQGYLPQVGTRVIGYP